MNETWENINGSFMPHMDPPSPIEQDYIRAVVNGICIVIGLPINLLTLYHQLSRHRFGVSRKLSLLHLHLNISDIMTLIFYSLGELCWFLTWRWRGGNIGCKLLHFVQSVSFSSSGNIMVCIALCRLNAMAQPLQASTPEARTRARRYLTAAWILACLTSTPLLFIYEYYEINGLGGWGQCVSIWFKMRYEGTLTDFMFSLSDAYNLFHLVVMFWIPLLSLLVCYALLIRAIFYGSNRARGISIDSSRAASPSRLSLFSRSPAPGRKGEKLRKLLPGRQATEKDIGDGGGLRMVSGVKTRDKSRTRALKVTLLLLSLYFIFWVPYNAIGLWMTVSRNSFKRFESHILISLALEFVVVNSVLNPLVYGSLKKDDVMKRPSGRFTGKRTASAVPSQLLTPDFRMDSRARGESWSFLRRSSSRMSYL